MSTAEDDLRLALELADTADSITMARYRASDLVVDTKPDLTPVTEADRDVEQALRRRLEASRTPERRARDLEIAAALEQLRG